MPRMTQYLEDKTKETVNSMTTSWDHVKEEPNYAVVQAGTTPPTHSFYVGYVEVNNKKYLVYQIDL